MIEKSYIYGARDTNTSKLVRDITNPGHKFWEKKGSCQAAIDAYNRGNYYRRRNNGSYNLELVTFELVEVNDNG